MVEIVDPCLFTSEKCIGADEVQGPGSDQVGPFIKTEIPQNIKYQRQEH